METLMMVERCLSIQILAFMIATCLTRLETRTKKFIVYASH